MAVHLNHTIVSVRDKHASATFLAEILGLDRPTPYGPFLIVQIDNDVSLDFADDHGPVHPQHYAFLVTETEFDEIFGRIRACGLPYWADPERHRPGEINQRRRPRRVLGGSERTLPRDHHPPLRQRRLSGPSPVSDRRAGRLRHQATAQDVGRTLANGAPKARSCRRPCITECDRLRRWLSARSCR